MLTINGAPVGRELGRYYLREQLEKAEPDKRTGSGRAGATDRQSQIANSQIGDADLADGSVIIVIATDAPVDARNLRRMAARAMMGLARTGAAATNGSGDYAIAFSTAEELRIRAASDNRNLPRAVTLLPNDAMSPLFLAVIEATEEAIYNSLFRAVAMEGRNGNKVDALPLEKTIEILRKYNAIPEAKK